MTNDRDAQASGSSDMGVDVAALKRLTIRMSREQLKRLAICFGLAGFIIGWVVFRWMIR